MTQEDKELLLKDLCARLPYNPLISINGERYRMEEISNALIGINTYKITVNGCDIEHWNIKPYLLPMSSMTDEMLEELNANGFFKYRDTIANVSHLESNGKVSEEIYTYIDIENISFLMEFFYSHHIDFRGLIPKGLAIDATGLGIY